MKNTASKLLLMGLLVVLGSFLAASSAMCAENWKEKYDSLCGRTSEADSMSNDELKQIIAETDKLQAEIQASDDPSKKVYLKKLKSCRGVFEYMLDVNLNKEK